jgi:DnaJ-class molecular chaperone
VTAPGVQVLGLGEGGAGVTADAIKKAYRRMAIKYHPDKQAHLGGEERARMERRFKQISEANTVLGNAGERRLYDMRRARRGPTYGARSAGGFGSCGRGGGGSFYSNATRSPYYEDDNDDDIYGNF